jgi:hypothetical protein
VAGDANYWWESGAVGDLVIRGNTFSAFCNSSEYQFCEAVISICPSLPRPGAPFHGRIVIEGNTFHSGGDPVLYALSVRELIFTRNAIHYDEAAPLRLGSQALLTLDTCGTATVKQNEIDAKFKKGRLSVRRMRPGQVDSSLA